jgi:predicted tellurium resistance membrane protein TerC
MGWLGDPQAWIGFVTLAVLEVVLGSRSRGSCA